MTKPLKIILLISLIIATASLLLEEIEYSSYFTIQISNNTENRGSKTKDSEEIITNAIKSIRTENQPLNFDITTLHTQDKNNFELFKIKINANSAASSYNDAVKTMTTLSSFIPIALNKELENEYQTLKSKAKESNISLKKSKESLSLEQSNYLKISNTETKKRKQFIDELQKKIENKRDMIKLKTREFGPNHTEVINTKKELQSEITKINIYAKKIYLDNKKIKSKKVQLLENNVMEKTIVHYKNIIKLKNAKMAASHDYKGLMIIRKPELAVSPNDSNSPNDIFILLLIFTSTYLLLIKTINR
jgi:hypothetical protein